MRRLSDQAVMRIILLLLVLGMASCGGGFSKQDELRIVQGRTIAQRFRTWIDQHDGTYPIYDSTYAAIAFRNVFGTNVYTNRQLVITSRSSIKIGPGDYFISRSMGTGDGDFTLELSLLGQIRANGRPKWIYQFRMDRTKPGVVQEVKL